MLKLIFLVNLKIYFFIFIKILINYLRYKFPIYIYINFKMFFSHNKIKITINCHYSIFSFFKKIMNHFLNIIFSFFLFFFD
jgi:hypothetical protein